MIQSNFRGFILRIFLSKLIKGIYNIINYLYSYTKFKKLILKLYTITFDAVDIFDKTKDPYFNLKINEIKKVVKIMLNNCLTRKLIFKKNEVDMINKITENNIENLEQKTIDQSPTLLDNSFQNISNKFITHYQNEELNKFQDEILSFFKNRDNYFFNLIISNK